MWYQSDAETKLFYSVVKYVNYLIGISININENYRSNRKFVYKIKQHPKNRGGGGCSDISEFLS